MTVQGDSNGDDVRFMTGFQEGWVNQDGEGATEQATMPDELRVDLSVRGFWKWGTSALFDIKIDNLDAGSYLCQTSVKALSMSEK